MKTRRALSRPSRDARIYGHTTTAMRKLSTAPPSSVFGPSLSSVKHTTKLTPYPPPFFPLPLFLERPRVFLPCRGLSFLCAYACSSRGWLQAVGGTRGPLEDGDPAFAALRELLRLVCRQVCVSFGFGGKSVIIFLCGESFFFHSSTVGVTACTHF